MTTITKDFACKIISAGGVYDSRRYRYVATNDLPGFQRIRHYGLLANRCRAVKLARCRQLLAEPAPVVEVPEVPLDYRDRYQLLTGQSLRDCPKCGHGHMTCIETFLPGSLPRGPPRDHG